MTRRARVLLVGLDAFDPAIGRSFSAAGRFPTLGQLFERAARCRVRNPFGLFVGSLWTTFATGLRPDRHRYHSWDEIEIATYVRRLTTPLSALGTPFWETLSAAGRRVAVLDVPHARAAVPLDGVQVAEWGQHDRHYGFHTWPPEASGRIETAFGLHPVLGIEPHSERAFASDDFAYRAGPLRALEEDRDLLGGMLLGLDGKRRLSTTLLGDGSWDLFLTVFGESHAIGHQQWHLHDPSHPRFDPVTTRALGGDPLLQVYEALDAALGELLSMADDDTTVFVLLSHGMGPHYDGTHLLDEVLRRIDSADRGERSRNDWGTLTPPPEYVGPEERARQRFFVEPNNSVFAGVRLNLAGREPHGCVQRDKAGAVVEQVTQDLLALVNVATGARVVQAVHRADGWYRRSPTDTMPDLFVDWERSGLIETVWSPKTGLVRAPYKNWRTGDHRPDGLLLTFGPGVPTARELPAIEIEDLAPSVAHRLGVVLEDIDGRPLPWLVRPSGSTG
jgi:predicted AlkP superfamily phosphohydrolase/phosphomutase